MDALPGIRKHFKKYFMLFPVAFRSLGPVDADVAWISSSGFAKMDPAESKNDQYLLLLHTAALPVGFGQLSAL